MSQPLAAALARLMAGTRQASAFTPAQRKALEEFARRTGAVGVVGDGRGNRYEIRDAGLLHAHLRSLRPQEAGAIDPGLPQRAANIAYCRNSKSRAHGHACHYLLVKAIGEGVLWRREPLETAGPPVTSPLPVPSEGVAELSAEPIKAVAGQSPTTRNQLVTGLCPVTIPCGSAAREGLRHPISGGGGGEGERASQGRQLEIPTTRQFDLSAATAITGVGALALEESDDWRSDRPLWLVENQALFDRLDWLPPTASGTLAYYAGELPEWLLRWLVERERATEVILFSDYDGVGLLNYARLRRSCAAPSTFWLMPEWQARLASYGNNRLWIDTQSEFKAALARLDTEILEGTLGELVRAMARQGLALEHEAVWLMV